MSARLSEAEREALAGVVRAALEAFTVSGESLAPTWVLDTVAAHLADVVTGAGWTRGAR